MYRLFDFRKNVVGFSSISPFHEGKHLEVSVDIVSSLGNFHIDMLLIFI